MSQGELLRKAKVIGRTKDGNRDVICSYDHNHFLNTLTYDVEFSYVEIKEYSVNVIAKNVYSQVDEDGYNARILDSIADCRKCSNVVDESDMCLRTKSTCTCLRHTAFSLSLLILWKN